MGFRFPLIFSKNLLRKLYFNQQRFSNSDAVTKDIVESLERLALVDFSTAAGIERLKKSIEFADKLLEVDTSTVEPMISTVYLRNENLQEDIPMEQSNRKELMDIAAVSEEFYYVAPSATAKMSSDLKNYKCTICSESFTKSYSLLRHLLLHTDGRPYQCTTCYSSFKQKSTLREHLLIHSGERPHQCPICDKSFRQQNAMKRHLIIHMNDKPFKCTVCMKSFNQKANLDEHSLIHTKEKPFTCPTCNKGIRHRSSFKKHLLIHTGEKPFECPKCKKCFNQQGSMKMHVVKVHGDIIP